MKIKNMDKLLPNILLVISIISLYACASNPESDAEIYSNEPVVVSDTANTQSQYNEPPSVSEASTDQSAQVESSGVAAPVEAAGFTEPPLEDMNGVAPPMDTPASEAGSSSMDSMAALDSTAETMPEPAMDMSNATTSMNISDAPADYFTVQVVASSSIENLNAFASKHDLSTELTAQVTVNGKTWHVLLLGTYATLAEAKAALANVQDKVTTSPWIRSIGSLR